MAKAPPHHCPRTLRWWAVGLVIVAVLGVAELGARAIGPNIERASGSEERAFIKADQMYTRDDQTDVVFLGSSETAGGMVPSIVDAEVPDLDGGYNAALAGATVELNEEWARRVVLPRLDPEVVVISILPTAIADLSGVDFDPAADTGPAYRSAFDQIDPGGLGSLGWGLRQRSALIRYRPLLRSPTAVAQGIATTLRGGDDEPELDDTRMDWETETDPDRVRALTEPDGEVLDYRAASVEGDNEMAVLAFTAASSLPVDLAPLEELIETVRDHGAVPVLSIAPVDRTVLEDGGADLSGLDRQVDDLAEWAEDRGVPFHSAFGEVWDPAWFHDRQHVDEAGGEAWSREVGTWLADLCAEGELGDAC